MILCVDIGFASLGYCIADPQGTVLEVGLCRTQRAKGLSSPVDALSRCRSLARQLEEVIARREGINLVRAESPSYPRHASTSTKLGMAWGILMAVVPEGVKVEIISPQFIRKNLGLPRGATKEDLCTVVSNAYPEQFSLIKGSYSEGLRQHIVDAMCVSLTTSLEGHFNEIKTARPVKGRTPKSLDLR